MAISLHTIAHPSNKKPRVRKGRGDAAAGSYSGRGMKGQRSRSGTSGFKERALRRFIQQIPKLRGFKSFKIRPETVDFQDLARLFENGAHISPKTLHKAGLISSVQVVVKILGTGTLAKKFTVSECQVTAGARARIEAAGGTIA